MAFTKATIDYLDAGGLIDWQTTAKTSAFTAVSGEGYLVDTTSAAITVTLPTAPSAGDEIIIVDYASNAGTNNITLDPGTLNLRGTTDDFVMATNDQSLRLLYSGATKGWLVTSDAGAGAAAAAGPDLDVDYLVVAGGGGGSGSAGGAGGGGGLRTSFPNTSSLAGHTESSLSLDTGTTYTVTVGLGGNGGTPTNSWVSTNGNDSVFSTITSKGGGYGSSNQYSPYTGSDGGSGGGGATTAGTSVFGSAVTSPVVHGYNAGSNNGGGGANSTGTGGSGGKAGNGGSGLSVSITGSAVTYAGGGGASGETSAGSGGSGGGGNGGYGTSSNGQAGTDGLGGGGGGAWNTAAGKLGGDGGNGIVILRYPDYYDIAVGSGLTTSVLNSAVGTDEKYTTFTAGTGSITFGAA